MIRYTASLDGITPAMLEGFFVDWGWQSHPSPETHLRLLTGSYRFWLAIDDESGQVVGFITAISDGVLSAYIPLLEVLESHQGRGIGLALVERMVDSLSHLYMIDLMCEEHLQPFYTKAGMRPGGGMMLRHYDKQRGVDATDTDNA